MGSSLEEGRRKKPNLLTRISQNAPTAQITSGGGFHPDDSRVDLVAGKRLGGLTSRAEALRQTPRGRLSNPVGRDVSVASLSHPAFPHLHREDPAQRAKFHALLKDLSTEL